MPDISNMIIENTQYNFKDKTARENIDSLFKFQVLQQTLNVPRK